MIIKPHFYNTLTIDIPLESENRVFIFNDSDIPDIYKILPSLDILITDYSIVLFDYLLLERPIIFAPFDLEEYMEKTTDFYSNMMM
jgi:CDP-glycerol glycerophosphotransferase (TagB/SpsB family)